MSLLEIVVISLSIAVVLANILNFIYKKRKHLPMGECSYCHKSKDQLLKEYHKLF